VKRKRAGASAISLCMIVRDEERFLPDCLESARGVADEIIVVDTGSSDATVSIAERFGARVLHHQWRDHFAAARNEALAAASGQWMLVLDADERLEQRTAPRIREAVADPNWENGFLHFINVTERGPCGRQWLASRFFRLTPGLRYIGRIHEQVVQQIPVIRSRIVEATVYHYGYQSLVHEEKQKTARNTRLLERALEDPEARDPLLRTNYLYHHANLASGGELVERYEAFARYVRQSWPRDPPRVPWITAGLAEYGRILNDVGRHSEARLVAAELLARHGESPMLRYLLARAAAAEGRLEEAEKELETVLGETAIAAEHLQYTQDPALVRGRAAFLLGLIREKQQRLEEAASHYQAAVREEPDQDRLRARLVCALVRLGGYREALETLEASGTLMAQQGFECLGLGLALLTESVGRLAFWGGMVSRAAADFPPAARLLERLEKLGAERTFRLEDFPELASAVTLEEDQPGWFAMPQTARSNRG